MLRQRGQVSKVLITNLWIIQGPCCHLFYVCQGRGSFESEYPLSVKLFPIHTVVCILMFYTTHDTSFVRPTTLFDYLPVPSRRLLQSGTFDQDFLLSVPPLSPKISSLFVRSTFLVVYVSGTPAFSSRTLHNDYLTLHRSFPPSFVTRVLEETEGETRRRESLNITKRVGSVKCKSKFPGGGLTGV